MTNKEIDKELQAQCLCRGCPSYLDCGDPLAYCLVGEVSKCINTRQGCICDSCPVWEKKRFENGYYCITKGGEQ